MRKFKIHLLSISLFILQSGTVLEAQPVIGSWKSHLSFAEAVQLADGGDRIYCATKSGLFFYHKTDHTVQTLTKVEGLSDLDVSSIVYDSKKELLVVAYKNANIDLIEGNEIQNIPDIKRKQLTGNKTIHNSLIIGDFAYLSCGFGIVVLNLEKK